MGRLTRSLSKFMKKNRLLGWSLFVFLLTPLVSYALNSYGVFLSTSEPAGHPISDALLGHNAKEKATIKGNVLSQIRKIDRVRQGNYYIQVLSTQPIENGVEVLVRAWDSDGNTIGFGKDGTIEIEKFRFINPPVLVDSPDGNIVRISLNAETREPEERLLKENSKEALLQVIEHTLDAKKEKFVNGKTVPGKIGNTTTTIYPDANPEVTSIDGWLDTDSTDLGWSSISSATGSRAFDDYTNAGLVFWREGSSANTWRYLRRSIFLFDTSALHDGDVVNSATMSLYGTAKYDPPNASPNIDIYTSNPASSTALTATDFSTIGSVSLTGSPISYASWSTSGYNNFSMNETGLANISKVGVSKFATRNANYDVTGNAPSWSGAGFSDAQLSGYYADETGTTKDPMLVVETSPLNLNSVLLATASAQYLFAPDSSSLSLTGDFTIEGWVKFKSFSTSEGVILSKYNDVGNQRSYQVGYYVSGGTGYFETRISSDGTLGNTTIKTLAYPLSTSTWYHLAFVYNGSAGTLDTYIATTSASTHTYAGQVTGHKTSVFNSTARIEIGSSEQSGDVSYIDGWVDDVRIWNVARTSSELNTDFKHSLVGTESGLQGYWNFDGSLVDMTANENDLEFYSFSTSTPF